MELREYLTELERRGLFVRIARPVNTRYELAGLVSRFQDCTLLFESVVGSDLPVVANVMSQPALLAKLVGVPPAQITDHLIRCIDRTGLCVHSSAIEPDRVVCGDVDLLRQFPLTIDYDRQLRPALNSGVLIARDQESGRLNTSFHVLQVISRDEFAVHVTSKHFAYIYSQYDRRGMAMPAAVLIGVDPWTWLAAAIVIQHPPTELEVAAAFRRQEVTLRACDFVDLSIPMGVEVVLEGEVLPHRREPMEAEPVPSGYYGPPSRGPVFRVKGWSRKKNALFLTLINGTLDHWTLLNLSKQVSLLPFLRNRHQGILGVAIHGPVCLVSLDRTAGQDVGAILSDVLKYDTSQRGNIKVGVVFDKDVNIHSRRDWEIALYTRLNRQRVSSVEGPASKADPSSVDGRLIKVGIDATVPPADLERFHLPHIPGKGDLDLLVPMS